MSPRRPRRHPSLRATTPALALALLLAIGCGIESSGDEATAGSAAPGFVLPVPEPIRRSAIETDALLLEVSLEGRPIEPVRVDDAWLVETVVPPGTVVSIALERFERLGEDDRLALAAWPGTLGPFSASASVELDPTEYESGADDPEGRFDRDADGLSNLEERAP